MLTLPAIGYRDVSNNLLATPAAQVGPNVAAGAVAHTKSATPVQLFASTAFEVEWIEVMVANTVVAAATTDSLLDIMVGAALGEQVLIPNILAGWATNITNGGGKIFSAPIYIAKGTRVSARTQSVVASKNIPTAVWLYGGARQAAQPTFGRCDAIGIDTATSRGTSVLPNATAGTEGTWTSVGAATARPYKALYFMVQGGMADVALAATTYHFEVGFNSTPLAEFVVGSNINEYTTGPFPARPIFHPIPTGTQLQVRSEASIASGEALDVALYGLY